VLLLLCDYDGTILDRAATFDAGASSFAATWALGAGAVEQLTTFDDRRYRERSELAALVSERFAVMAVIASCSLSWESAAPYPRVG